MQAQTLLTVQASNKLRLGVYAYQVHSAVLSLRRQLCSTGQAQKADKGGLSVPQGLKLMPGGARQLR